MPDPDGLDVHEVVVAHAPAFDQSGKMTHNTLVSYRVGPHGLFHLVYPPGQATPDKVNADIDKQVQEVRAIVRGRT